MSRTDDDQARDDATYRAVEAWLIAGLGSGAHEKHALPDGSAVLRVAKAPTGATAYSTIGLYRATYPKTPDVGRNRFEIIGASRREELSGYLAAAMQIIVRAGHAPLEGSVIANLATRSGMSDLANRFPHVVFLPPYFWEELDALRLDEITLVPVFALPINDAERAFLKARGTDAFIELVRKSKVDAFDLAREPMVVDRGTAH